jgi:microcystin-dependent protein
MASLWRKSQEVLRDDNDARAAGARASFFVAGTTTPLTVYRDNALAVPHPHPVRADVAGRMPAVFLALDTPYKERVETASGSLLWEVDHVDPAPAIATTGGGGGGTVDPLDLLDTGFLMPMFETGTKPGWVRANGRTIGNAASGASERANADCQALFAFLWNTTQGGAEGYCPVLPAGRGAAAAADFAANKQITLPDLRGRVLVGLNGMGNAQASALSGFAMDSGSTDTLLAPGGVHQLALTVSQLPTHNHGGFTAASSNTALYNRYLNLRSVQSGAGENNIWQSAAPDTVIDYPHQHAIPSQGNGDPHPNCQPFRLVTYYIKLKRGTA